MESVEARVFVVGFPLVFFESRRGSKKEPSKSHVAKESIKLHGGLKRLRVDPPRSPTITFWSTPACLKIRPFNLGSVYSMNS